MLSEAGRILADLQAFQAQAEEYLQRLQAEEKT
jgi:hypothetical protein